MVGAIQAVKPNARATDCRRFINDRIRRLIDRKIFWADLLARGIVVVPNAYIQGTLTLTLNSATAVGVGTAWPVADVVNTVLPAGVQDFGYQEVQPASMAGITTDSVLYIDAGGPTPEVVSVISTTPGSFTAKFSQFHNPNCTITASSLAGLQLKIGGGSGTNYPIYNVQAIVSPTSALLDLPWGGPTASGYGYQMLKMYYTLAPDFKDFICVWDPIRGQVLKTHMNLQQVNWEDPQRTNTGDPVGFVDHSVSDAGSMLYELWPNQTGQYQLEVVYCRQWPELINPTDRPPFFINPSVIVDGAIADALRVRNGSPADGADPWFAPKLADTFEAKWNEGLLLAIQADESKALRALDYFMGQYAIPGGGAAFWQSHDPDLYFGL